MSKFDCLRGHTFIPKFSQNSIILDFGGYYGEFSKLFSQKYLYKKIVVVEANPNLIETIKLNLKGISNIELIHAAIGADKNKEIIFNINSSDLKASSIFPELAEVKGLKENQIRPEVTLIQVKDNEKVKVNSISFKSICNKFKKIDLIKMDIEGAEWEIIESFDKEDYEKIEQISVEFHDFLNPNYKKRSENCVIQLKKFGYKIKSSPGAWGYGTPYMDCIFYKE